MHEAIVQYRGRAPKAAPQIREAWQAVDLARRVVRDHAREHLLAPYHKARHRPIAYSAVSVGTATASLVHPREVSQAVVLTGAAALLVLHDDPSRDPNPSAGDEAVTTRLRDAGKIIGQLLDSIV